MRLEINFNFLSGKNTQANLKTLKTAHSHRCNHVTKVSKTSPTTPSLKPTPVSSPLTGKTEVLSIKSCYNMDESAKRNKSDTKATHSMMPFT